MFICYLVETAICMTFVMQLLFFVLVQLSFKGVRLKVFNNLFYICFSNTIIELKSYYLLKTNGKHYKYCKILPRIIKSANFIIFWG